MTEEKFSEQVLRLTEVFGAKHYTAPRLKILLASMKGVKNDVFERSVTRLIASKRAVPLLPEFLDAIESVEAEDKQRLLENAPQVPGTFLGQLEQSAARNTTADPEYVKLCLKTLRTFLDGKMSRDEFRNATDSLDSMARQIDPKNVRRDLQKAGHRWEFV